VLAFLNSGTLAEHLTRRFALIEAQIAAMQSAIARINQGLEGASRAAAASGS
jgi:hypothetical protein